MMGLTEKQLQLLVFIKNYTESRSGISPSYEEMMVHLDLQSKSGIHRLVHTLKEKRFIRVLSNRARSIEVLKCPGMEKPEFIKSFLGDELYRRANVVRGKQSLKQLVCEATECFVEMYEDEMEDAA